MKKWTIFYKAERVRIYLSERQFYVLRYKNVYGGSLTSSISRNLPYESNYLNIKRYPYKDFCWSIIYNSKILVTT